MISVPITPDHQDYILQELEKLNVSSLDLDKTYEASLNIRMHEIQRKLANNESLSVWDVVSLQEIIKNDRVLNEKKNNIETKITKYESIIKGLEDKKRKIEKMRAINEAARVDIEKYSQTYFIDWVHDYSRKTLTDDAIKSYLQQELELKVKLNDIPHKDAKFASWYATLASSALTGLFAYYAWHNYERGVSNALSLSYSILLLEFLLCDTVLDAFFPTSKLAYYLSSGIRIAIPTVAGGAVLFEKAKRFAEDRTGLRPK
jgi:hypothetical protein